MIGKRVAWTVAVLAVVGAGVGVVWDQLRIQPPTLNAAEAADKPSAAVDKDLPKPPEKKEREADRDAVQAAVKNLEKVFEKGDGKTLADLWTEEGEYVGDDAATLRGRAAIADGYAQFFKKNAGVKLELTIESVRFLSRDSAVVEGAARSYKGGKAGEPTSSRVSALYARDNGQWLIALLREWPDEGAALRDVDWLIGSWEAKNDVIDVRTTYEWDEGRNFIRARFTIKNKEKDVSLSGTQLIGKDPRTGLLHSWLFESDGGFSEAVWNWDGKQWRLDAAGVEADGDETTATNLLTPVDKDSFTWQSIDRTLDGEAAPNIPPVKVTRVK
jgi:uncharacterized protein (TIGR02246 family)